MPSSMNFSQPSPDFGVSGGPSTTVAFREEGAWAYDELERLAWACLDSLESALLQVDAWRRCGHGLEDIYLRGMAPCARLLGHWWRCDTADFGQVTIASSNLQRVLYRLSEEFCAPGANHPLGLSLLLATEPRAQHTLGAFMLSEFFRRHGWTVQTMTPHDSEDVVSQLRRDWYDAVGLSISTGRELQPLLSLLPRLRDQSPNPNLRVLVGGPLAFSRPQDLQALGVDLVSGDARETVRHLSQQVLCSMG
jgi:methylmalonyl-CoA mutase cobalamin-binding subunit